MRKEIPFWQKSNLTIEEAAAYSGIGENRIRELTNTESCPFVLWVGTKRLIKRRKFDEFVENADCQPKRPPVPYSAATL